LRGLRRLWVQRRSPEELELHVLRVAAEGHEPELAIVPVERLVPLHGLADVGDRVDDQLVEALAERPLPLGHGRFVGLNRPVAVALGDLRVATGQKLRSGLVVLVLAHGNSQPAIIESGWTAVAL